MTRQIIRHKKRCGYDGCYFLIVPDNAAGSRHRYTVYQIPSSPGVAKRGRVKVIGRELTLGLATNLCRKQP